MNTSVIVNTYSHSVTYVAENLQKTLKNIVVLSGLDPGQMIEGWASTNLAISTWMQSKDLEKITLEIFKPTNNELVGRWDIEIAYGWSADDGRFWVDTEQIKTAIRKAGVHPSSCGYALLLKTKPGRPDVAGWGTGSYRSTDGFVKQSLGGTVQHSGLGADASYYRRKT